MSHLLSSSGGYATITYFLWQLVVIAPYTHPGSSAYNRGHIWRICGLDEQVCASERCDKVWSKIILEFVHRHAPGDIFSIRCTCKAQTVDRMKLN